MAENQRLGGSSNSKRPTSTTTKAFVAPRLPSIAPPVLSDSTTFISDPSRIYTLHTLIRERKLQYLTSLYMTQLRYGCPSLYCKTPTCLSCQRRVSEAPVRPMTLLSAKAIAYVLIGMEDPEAAICPHLTIERISLARGGLEQSDSRKEKASSDFLKKVGQDSTSPKEDTMVNKNLNKKRNNLSASRETTGQNELPHDKQSVIDNKNLTQTMFNTTAVDDFMSHVIGIPSWVKEALHQESGKSFETEKVSWERQGDAEEDSGISVFKRTQSLTRFSHDSVCALQSLVRFYSIPTQGKTTEVSPQNPDYKGLSEFVEQSIFYVFGNLEAINHSFSGLEDTVPCQKGPPGSRRLHSGRIYSAFRRLKALNDKVLYESLWIGIGPLFSPPAELVPPRSPRLKAALSNNKSQGSKMRIENPKEPVECKDSLDDSQILHAIIICCHALCAVFYRERPEVWSELISLRSRGCIGPDKGGKHPDLEVADRLASMIDGLENDLYLRLAARLIRLIAARAHYAEIMNRKGSQDETYSRRQYTKPTIAKNLCEYFVAFQNDHTAFNEVQEGFPFSSTSGWSMPGIILEWTRTLLLREWNGKNEVDKLDTVGSCLEFLSILYERHVSLGLELGQFYTPAIADRLDAMDAPAEWLASSSNSKTVRVLSYPFLFPPKTLVSYFRALNYAKMSAMVEGAMTLDKLISEMIVVDPDRALGDWNLRSRLKTALSHLFVLKIRRENVLTDALDQLWRRERRELLRPLKVRIGTEEGELGVDHGGVQQEFFRVAIAEAFNVDYGIFTIDSNTQMAWFQPCCLEPLYKFELLGLLVSLAVYNGITLPVTFPLALYHKLLDLPVDSIHDIEDGWPDLAKGLWRLLSWQEGDVGDVFFRTYEISIPTVGGTVDVDMLLTNREDPWPPAQAIDILPAGKKMKEKKTEARLVTNANRERFVEDYVFWLTDKSIRPQFEAFARGFFVCIDRKALRIFTPEALQKTVEGEPTIDMAELEATAQYELPYHSDHPLIKDFWSMVKSFPQTRQRQLLEFVTACDRVPVMGMSSVSFHILRSGPDTERIPTAMTCFGRLMLPEYESAKKMRRKMRVALDNSIGFGVA